MTKDTAEWDNAKLPKANVSANNKVELVIITNPTDIWNRPHEENEFCLAGVARSGNYSYQSTGASDYDKMLYWDNTLGGISTVENIYSALEDGKSVACYAYATRWAKATGRTVPAIK